MTLPAVFSVEVVVTMAPGYHRGEGCKQVVESPADDDVIVDV